MKKALLFLILISTALFGQFKDQLNNGSSIHDGLIKSETPSMILGFINPSNFSMHHSYSLSYSGFSGGGMALGVYTNSMAYKFTDNLNVQVDASIVNSPYNSFGKDFTNQINGIYLSRAQLNYRPTENMNINIQYRSYPAGVSPYGYGGYGYSRSNFMMPFDDEWFYGR